MELILTAAISGVIAFTIFAIRKIVQRLQDRDQQTEHKLDLFGLKALAGNVSEEDAEWFNDLTEKYQYRIHPTVKKYACRYAPDLHERTRKKRPDAVETATNMITFDHSRPQSYDDYFPKSSDFLGMKQAAAGLQKDIRQATSCVVPSTFGCGERKTLQQLQKENQIREYNS